MDSVIPATVPMDQLLALSGAEKIAVIGALWDSIDDSTAAGPPPDWQLDELQRRETADLAHPEPTMSWEEALKAAKTSHAQTRSA